MLFGINKARRLRVRVSKEWMRISLSGVVNPKSAVVLGISFTKKVVNIHVETHW